MRALLRSLLRSDWPALIAAAVLYLAVVVAMAWAILQVSLHTGGAR